jgi:signal peptidase I
MTKRKYPPAGPVPRSARRHVERSVPLPAPSAPEGISRHLPTAAGIRETVESIVVAFVLAFLFRTFEAEAFVIPTGSMAPTLMGRHKDLDCPKCGCNYQVSASEEVDAEGGAKNAGYQTAAGTCPMCRYTALLGPDNPQHIRYPSYSGDRILVSKFAYDLNDPLRWDVIVFKFPGDATTDSRTNFIKRLVGLPGETVRIQRGDLWVKRDEEPFQIARKPPQKLLAMLQPVFDNDYMPRIADEGWPARWQPEAADDQSGQGAWSSDDYVTFQTDGSSEGERWLRYHHLVPSYPQWKALELEGKAAAGKLTPQLITDFTAYNTARVRGSDNPVPEADSVGLYWVGDLALGCTVEVKNTKGELLFELRKGGRQFYCRLDVATGQATLSISGEDMRHFQPHATTAVRGPGRHEIRFSNCDNELRLWVDGVVVAFDAATTYADLGNTLPEESDHLPVGIATVGANVQLSHLIVSRDLYYIADLSYAGAVRFTSDDGGFLSVARGADVRLRNQSEEPVDFVLKADQFFVLGDNSARSKDGRLWGADNYTVPRELLIGKALFIYWPHSWNRVPYVHVPFPFFPNFARMGLVR